MMSKPKQGTLLSVTHKLAPHVVVNEKQRQVIHTMLNTGHSPAFIRRLLFGVS